MIVPRNRIIYKNDVRPHLLRHFQNLDQDFITLLEIEHGLSPDEINNELRKSGSKFYPYFACNPDQCFRRLMENYFGHELEPYNDGKRVSIHFSFPDPIGMEGIASEDELSETELQSVITGEYRGIEVREVMPDRKIETCEAHMILDIENPEANVITFFPGKYAPPLPDPELQSDLELRKSTKFWKQHFFIRYL